MAQGGPHIQLAVIGQVDGHVAGRAVLYGPGQGGAEAGTGAAALADAQSAAALSELATQLPALSCVGGFRVRHPVSGVRR